MHKNKDFKDRRYAVTFVCTCFYCSKSFIPYLQIGFWSLRPYSQSCVS